MGLKQKESVLVMALIMAAAPVCAQTAADAVTPPCTPGKPLQGPRYPIEMVKRGINGTVVLDLTLDACGLVLDAIVKQGDKKAFNEAALASVRGVTLTPSQRAGARDGRLTLPIDFKLGKDLSYQKIDWPTTHRRPRYELDNQAMVYATAVEANAAIKSSPDYFWPSPYAVQSRFVQVGEPAAREFWLFIYKSGVANVAVHYRPLMVEDQPVVKLAMRCSDTPEACSKTESVLLQGLPFAKAKK